MSMNLAYRFNGTYYDLPYQLSTKTSYRMLFEDYHWVGNEGKSHNLLRRSSPMRTFNKYRDYVSKRHIQPLRDRDDRRYLFRQLEALREKVLQGATFLAW